MTLIPDNFHLLDRRQFIAGSASLTAGLVSGMSATANTGSLDQMIVEKTKALLAGQSARLRCLIPQGSSANLAPVVAAFADRTGVVVDILEVPVDEINSQLILDALTSDVGYDLALPATFGIPDLAEAGVIQPLTDYAKAHEPAGFREGILYDVGDSFDNEIYGFQTDGDAYLMFYNKAMLEDPKEIETYHKMFDTDLEVPKTWAELDRQMAFFHRPEDGSFGGVMFRTPFYMVWEWWVRFHAKGIWPMSPDLTPQIASTQGVEALDEMIAATQHQIEGVRSFGLFENWEKFEKGNIYCNIGWGGTQKHLNSDTSRMRGNLVFGQTPGGIVDDKLLLTPYFNWGWNYVVTMSSKQAELAYLFAFFASTPAISTAAVQQSGGYFDPFRSEHYADPVVEEAYSREFLDVHESSMKSAIPDFYLANKSEYFGILSEWLDRAMAGTISSKDALSRAAQKWRILNNRSDIQQQTRRWQELRAKYPEKISSLLRDIPPNNN